jgi:hypothetical protein
MKEHQTTLTGSKSRDRFILFGIFLAGLGSFFALYKLVMLAIEKVIAGQGMQTYRTVWLVEFSYIGLLTLIAAILIALFAAFIFWWDEERQWREFEQKYTPKDVAKVADD